MSDPFESMTVGEIQFLKTRRQRKGQWIPVSLWIRDGERDEQGDLISDQEYGATINGEDTLDYYDICEKSPFWHASNKQEYDHLLECVKWREGNGISEKETDFFTAPMPF